jgi:predicted nucleic acid-binding protein
MVMHDLLDTNIFIYWLGGQLAEPIPTGNYKYSVITEIELKSFAQLDEAALEKINQALEQMERIELTAAIREATITLRRQHKLKLPDAIIVASAIATKARLVTNDDRLHKIADLVTKSLPLRH